jgi:fumarate reductase subunit C
MNAIAGFFEATYMAQVGGPLVFLGFLLHFVLAARKIPFRAEGQKTIWQHARMMHHGDTWLWVVQVVSAMLILVMGSIHMWVVLTDLPISAAKSAARVQSGFWAVFYFILLPLAELHVGIGFYRIGVKWGFIKDRERDKFKRGENLLTGMFIAIGLITLVRFLFLSLN